MEVMLPVISPAVFESLSVDGKGINHNGSKLANWHGGTLEGKLGVQAAIEYAADHPEIVAAHHVDRVGGSDADATS